MGFMNFGARFLSDIDGWLAQFLPAVLRLMFWAAFGAVVSLELYRFSSPQSRIERLKRAFDRTQRYLAEFDGEFAEAWPHLRTMIVLALKRIGLVLPATLLASLPLVALIFWLDSRYGTAPAHQVLSFGPAWARGWQGVFFAAMVVFAFAFKTARRII